LVDGRLRCFILAVLSDIGDLRPSSTSSIFIYDSADKILSLQKRYFLSFVRFTLCYCLFFVGRITIVCYIHGRFVGNMSFFFFEFLLPSWQAQKTECNDKWQSGKRQEKSGKVRKRWTKPVTVRNVVNLLLLHSQFFYKCCGSRFIATVCSIIQLIINYNY